MVRILRVIVALVLSVFAGAITLTVLSARWAMGQFEDAAYASDPILPLGQVTEMMIYSIEFAPALTLLPALVAVLLGEVLRIRSVLYYVAAGGIAAVIVPASAGVMALAPVDAGAGGIAPGLPIFATAGFAAGFVYWLIAGRKA